MLANSTHTPFSSPHRACICVPDSTVAEDENATTAKKSLMVSALTTLIDAYRDTVMDGWMDG